MHCGGHGLECIPPQTKVRTGTKFHSPDLFPRVTVVPARIVLLVLERLRSSQIRGLSLEVWNGRESISSPHRWFHESQAREGKAAGREKSGVAVTISIPIVDSSRFFAHRRRCSCPWMILGDTCRPDPEADWIDTRRTLFPGVFPFSLNPPRQTRPGHLQGCSPAAKVRH